MEPVEWQRAIVTFLIFLLVFTRANADKSENTMTPNPAPGNSTAIHGGGPKQDDNTTAPNPAPGNSTAIHGGGPKQDDNTTTLSPASENITAIDDEGPEQPNNTTAPSPASENSTAIDDGGPKQDDITTTPSPAPDDSTAIDDGGPEQQNNTDSIDSEEVSKVMNMTSLKSDEEGGMEGGTNDTIAQENLCDHNAKKLLEKIISNILRQITLEKTAVKIFQKAGNNPKFKYNANITASGKHCGEVVFPDEPDGVYVIQPPSSKPFEVYCIHDTDGGPPWTVFQRRHDGSEDFYRTMPEYSKGFGNATGEYWMGNDRLHAMTFERPYELWIEMEAYDGTRFQANYTHFAIASVRYWYEIRVLDGFTGQQGDSLSYHAGAQFTAKDFTSFNKCAQKHKGGWWYKECYASNLNGLYQSPEGKATMDKGIVWNTYMPKTFQQLKYVHMAIRPRLKRPLDDV